MLSRRRFALGAAGFFLLRTRWPVSDPATPMTVYKSRTCGCCIKWIDHVKAAGFDPKIHDEDSMDRLKDELGVPQPIRSCHTALVGQYLIEGHVPAADIRRLLAEKPKVAGLAVPGMPSGTPGMAEPGSTIGGFEVVAFRSDGSTLVFASH